MSNPAQQSVFAQFSADLLTSTQAIFVNLPAPLGPLSADQVEIGHIEFFTNADFYRKVADCGPHFIIGLPEAEGSFFDFNGSFQVVAHLFYPVPADQSYDWQNTNNLCGALIANWSHWTAPGGSSWVKGRNRSPVKFKMKKPFIRYYEKPCGKYLKKESFIVSQEFTFTMPFVTDQAGNPYLEPPAS